MSSRRHRRARDLRVGGPWATVIQSSAFVRKELAEIVRQPRLILLLIVGPFALLMLFGTGYRSESLGLRTMFVGPPDSVYEDAVADYREMLERFVDPGATRPTKRPHSTRWPMTSSMLSSCSRPIRSVRCWPVGRP